MPQPPQDGMPPMGNSPATSPTPNAGEDAQAMQHAALILDAATELLPRVKVTSPTGEALMKFIQAMSKIVQPGSVSPAGKQNQLDQMQRNNVQQGQQLSMVRQQEQQPPAAGGQ